MLIEKTVKNENYRVQSLERAFDILDCFDYEHTSFTLNELAEKTGLNKATTRRLAYNLEARGFLQQDPGNKAYQLGMHLFELGRYVLSNMELRTCARPHLENLSKQLGATVLCSIPSDDFWIVIEKFFGYHTISMPSEVGTRRQISSGLQGQIFLAGMDDESVHKILIKHPLQAYTPFSLTDNAKYWPRLRKVRENGYAIESEEYMEGLMGIAVPVKNHRKQTVASVLVGLPAKRSEDKVYIESVVNLIKAIGNQISHEMGYRP